MTMPSEELIRATAEKAAQDIEAGVRESWGEFLIQDVANLDSLPLRTRGWVVELMRRVWENAFLEGVTWTYEKEAKEKANGTDRTPD